jgi:hypothetical protein
MAHIQVLGTPSQGPIKALAWAHQFDRARIDAVMEMWFSEKQAESLPVATLNDRD